MNQGPSLNSTKDTPTILRRNHEANLKAFSESLKEIESKLIKACNQLRNTKSLNHRAAPNSDPNCATYFPAEKVCLINNMDSLIEGIQKIKTYLDVFVLDPHTISSQTLQLGAVNDSNLGVLSASYVCKKYLSVELYNEINSACKGIEKEIKEISKSIDETYAVLTSPLGKFLFSISTLIFNLTKVRK